MEFDLTDEQQQMKMSVREFAESEIAPHVMEWDETQHFPIELRPKLAELGLLGVFSGRIRRHGLAMSIRHEIEELRALMGLVGISVAEHTRLVRITFSVGTKRQKQNTLCRG